MTDQENNDAPDNKPDGTPTGDCDEPGLDDATAPDDLPATDDLSAPDDLPALGDKSAPEADIAPAPYRPKHTPLWNNVITLFGFFVVAVALILLMTFGLFSVVSPAANPYVDIVGYLILPMMLIVGLLIVPVGILIKSWRLRRVDPLQHLSFRLPRIDLNDPIQRRVAKYFTGITFVLLPVVGVSSYHGYHYTDSTEFCGQACHAAMEPQATAYEDSAHARVACAECHIGEGAGWFVKSKLSGTRQVLAMWRDTYSRPIPPAITHLRPARETCEHCHWPKKFFGAQLRNIVRFASDEENTRTEIGMLVKTGGGDESSGRAEGIHLHMALEAQIEYIATDDKLQEIPWVRMTDEAGNVTIYRTDGRPSSDPPPQGQVRNFDCMDCHNRPAHNFRSPQESVDSFLDIGRIDPALPFIKREATEVLSVGYPDKETALARIGGELEEFYQSEHPEIWKTHKAGVYQAIDAVRAIYQRDFFPRMKVDWRTYPDNIGHKDFDGCFRCHDGKHVDSAGKTIRQDCHICHTFIQPLEGQVGAIMEGHFVHPLPLEGAHAQILCSQCHDGGPSQPATCDGCHAATTGLRTADHALLAPFGLEADAMAYVDCESCHDVSEPVSIDAIDEMCLECHDPDDDERFDGMLARWVDSMGQSRGKAEAAIARLEQQLAGKSDASQNADAIQWLNQNKQVLDLLDKAGPMHHFEGSTKVYGEIEAGAREFAAEQ